MIRRLWVLITGLPVAPLKYPHTLLPVVNGFNSEHCSVLCVCSHDKCTIYTEVRPNDLLLTSEGTVRLDKVLKTPKRVTFHQPTLRHLHDLKLAQARRPIKILLYLNGLQNLATTQLLEPVTNSSQILRLFCISRLQV